jgi:threonine synthase
MELWHGPTLAFKDMALTVLPHLLTGAREICGEDKKTLILVATSGDTGMAALAGFADVPDTEIVVLYPSEGVSKMQKLQMQTAQGDNVHVFAIKGNFDDAQSAVKDIFNDKDAVAKLYERGYSLSSANSINWGRLQPQIAYYISAYADLLAGGEIEEGEKVNFVVPTGNFGNVLAAYYAKMMGLPVKDLIVASNMNNVLADFFASGEYDINRPFYKTISPSMDILISSNFERLLFELTDRDAERVKELMADLQSRGTYMVDKALLDKIAEFKGFYSTEEETFDSIANFFEMYDYLIDPHTSVAVSCLYKYLALTDSDTKNIVVSTASPYKFAQDVYKAITGKEEADAFRAIDKLAEYSATDVPEVIAALKGKEVLHNGELKRENIKNSILELFGCTL